MKKTSKTEINEIRIVNYNEVTDTWHKNVMPNKNKYKIRNYYQMQDGTRHRVNGKTIKHDYKEDEIEVALLLQKQFGGNVYMIPKVDKPQGISTPDYQYINKGFNDYLELKTLKESGKNTILTNIDRGLRQTDNIVIDLRKTSYSDDEIIKNIELIFQDKNKNDLTTLIVIKDNIRVYKRE